MKKIAIFVEGQAELIFVREMLCKIYNYNLAFTCHKLQSKRLVDVKYNFPNPTSNLEFQIVNVQSDEGVLTTIRDLEEELYARGFDKIIGLRDMFSDDYKKAAQISCVKDEVTNSFKVGAQKAINKIMRKPENIKLFFSIMEIEAWFLAMPNVFIKINSELTCDEIKEKLDYIFEEVERIFHPANKMIHLFSLCNLDYDKRESDIEKIVANIEQDDIEMALQNSQSFKDFYSEIISY